MKNAVENTKRELATIRSGKATTSLLDTIRVDAYGQSTPLNQVGSVAAPEPRMITVQPWDKGLIDAIERAIQTEERRKELVKVVRKLAEEGKIAVRHGRTEAISHAKKVEHISKDDERHTEKDVQQIHDDAIEQIDQLVKGKEVEIMEV